MNVRKYKQLLLVLLCSLFGEPMQAQHFTLKTDTFRINADDYVTSTCRFDLQRSTKCRDYYFCCYRQYELNSTNDLQRNHLLAISLDGQEIKNVPFPRQLDGDRYFDLFARKDTLYAKPYHDAQITFRFNYEQWSWDVVENIEDIVFEDDDWQVVFKDFGEWGTCIWFVNKKSSKQYLWRGLAARFVKLGGSYYFHDKGGLWRIDEPEKGMLCTSSTKYDAPDVMNTLIKRAYKASSQGKEYNSQIGMADTVLFFYDPEEEYYMMKKYDTSILNMFSCDGKLLLWLQPRDSTCLVSVENGNLMKMMNFPATPWKTFSWMNSYRGNNLASNGFLMQFKEDRKTYGLIDVKDTLISIHYLISNQDTLSFIGKDNIQPLLDYLLAHADNLTLSAIDSVERQYEGTHSTLITNVYQEEKSWTKRQPDENYMKMRYFKLVDSSMVVETSYNYNRIDAVVDEFNMILHKPNYYNSDVIHRWRNIAFKDEQYQQLKALLTQIVGEEPVWDEQYGCWRWNFHGRTLSLGRDRICFER